MALAESLTADKSRISVEYDALKDKEVQLQKRLNDQLILVSKSKETLQVCTNSIEHQKKILHRYEISEKYVFENDINMNIIQEKLSILRNKLENSRQKSTHLCERLESFNKNQLHVSNEFAKILQQNNINFQTGEEYLSNQSEYFRKELLQSNPILPYSFIVNDAKDFEKVLHFDSDTTIDRVCPVVYRNDIDSAICEQGDFKVVELEKYHIYGLYDYKSIDPEMHLNYGKYLQNEISTLKKRCKTLEKSIQECLQDLKSVGSFEYKNDSLETLEQNLKQENAVLDDIQKQLEACKKSQNEAQSTLLELSESISQNHIDLNVAEKKLADFEDYVVRSNEDIANLLELNNVENSLKKVNNDIKILKSTCEKISKSIMEVNQESAEVKSDIKMYSSKANQYAHFIENKIIDEPLEQLEIEYDMLVKNAKYKKSELEIRCTQLDKAISNEKNTLQNDYPDLTQNDYNIEFDRSKLNELKEQLEQSTFQLNVQKISIETQKREVFMHKKQFESSVNALKRNGLESPLDKSEILGNYDARQEDCKIKLDNAKQLDKRLDAEIKSLEANNSKLYRVLNLEVETLDDVQEITQSVDIESLCAQYKALNNELKDGHKLVLNTFNNIAQLHTNDSDSTINKILDTVKIDQISTYLCCCQVSEKLDVIQNGLNSQIAILDSILKHFSDNHKHVVHQVYTHAKQLYEQILWIPKHSYVNFGGTGKRQTLELDIPKELDNQAETRIENMVNNVFTKLRNSKIDDTTEYINESFSNRAMFNAITNTNKVGIKVYKVRQDGAGTLERWESVYSGGERFLTYFIVYSALTTYTKSRITPEIWNKTRSVFLIDNPFGATSSTHLLQALVEITSRFNLQLVCFSDLKQSSITNNFNLIYQLSLKRAMYGKKSYLTIDNVTGNDTSKIDHNLEYIYLKQLDLFG